MSKRRILLQLTKDDLGAAGSGDLILHVVRPDVREPATVGTEVERHTVQPRGLWSISPTEADIQRMAEVGADQLEIWVPDVTRLHEALAIHRLVLRVRCAEVIVRDAHGQTQRLSRLRAVRTLCVHGLRRLLLRGRRRRELRRLGIQSKRSDESERLCPCCNAPMLALVRRELEVHLDSLGHGVDRVRLCDHCPECTVRLASGLEDKERTYDKDDFTDPEADYMRGNDLNRDMTDARLELMEAAGVDLDPPSGARAFEVGCGPGNTLVGLRDRGWEVAGIDPAPFAVEYCTSRLGLADVRIGGAEDLDASIPAQQNLIVIAHTLEHLQDPWAALRACHGGLVSGGRIYVEVPEWPRFADDLWQPDHLAWFTPTGLERWLERAGFTDIRLVRDGIDVVVTGKPWLAASAARP